MPRGQQARQVPALLVQGLQVPLARLQVSLDQAYQFLLRQCAAVMGQLNLPLDTADERTPTFPIRVLRV